MANPPSYDFYHSDFTAGTYMMSLAEVGCYIRLLNHQFVEGQIPNNPAVMSRLCVCDQVDFDRAWAVVKQKFQKTEDGTGYVNAKMVEIRQKTLKRWTANRENGKLGGRPKKPSGSKWVSPTETQTEPNGKEEVGSRKRKMEEEDGSSEDGSCVGLVIQHYQTFHPRSRPGQKEQAKVAARLAEGYSVEDLKSAIDGCHRSPFHSGVNDDQRKYQTLELIVRDASKVNQFMEVPEIGSEPVFDKKTQRSVLAGHSWLDRKEREDNGQK